MTLETKKLLTFFKTIQGLKEVIRFKNQVFWRDYPFPERYESVADHTWRMAVMLMVMEKHLAQPINLAKALTMALLHDLPEIIAGDASPLGEKGTGEDAHPYNEEAAQKKRDAEEAAAQEIFGQLPEEQGQEFYGLWREYERQDSFEAKLVKAIDRIEGKLQALEYTKGNVYKQHQQFNVTYGNETYSIDPAIEELGMAVVEEFREQFKEYIP